MSGIDIDLTLWLWLADEHILRQNAGTLEVRRQLLISCTDYNNMNETYTGNERIDSLNRPLNP